MVYQSASILARRASMMQRHSLSAFLTSGPRGPGFEPRSGLLVFSLSKEINRHCSLGMLDELLPGPEPLFASRVRPSPLNYKNEPGGHTGEGNCSPGHIRLYRLSVSPAEKAKESEIERPQLRAS